MIGIQICSNYEWSCVKELLRISEELYYPYGAYFYHSIGGRACLFFRGGVRKTKSAGVCQYMISHQSVRTIYLIGTCGGVNDSLKILDLIMATQTVQYDCLPQNSRELILNALTSDIDLNEIEGIAANHPMLTYGTIGTSDTPLVDIEMKQKLMKAGILCSDCESASVAYICHLNQIPCYIIRGISDFPETEQNQAKDCVKNTPLIFEKILCQVLPDLIY